MKISKIPVREISDGAVEKKVENTMCGDPKTFADEGQCTHQVALVIGGEGGCAFYIGGVKTYECKYFSD